MKTKGSFRLPVLATSVAACCLAGCTKSSEQVGVNPVHGQVLFDGKPVGGAMVVLHPLEGAASTEVRPLAFTKEDGTFNVATYASEDGAPAGKYVATVQWLVRPKGAEDEQIIVPNKLPLRYGDPQSSRLSVDVVAGANDLPPFQLTR